MTQPKLKPATIRLAAQCSNPNLPEDNDDNHKKLQVACLLAENNIRIRSTAFHFTKSFDRILYEKRLDFYELYSSTCV